MAKILIIGAGIIGSALAYSLTKSGAKVTLIDPNGAGGDASAHSFGWVNATYENPRPYFDLRMAAMAEWQALKSKNPDLPYTQNGTIYCDFYGIPLTTVHAEHTPWGYPLYWLSQQDAQHKEPNLNGIPTHSLHCPIEGYINPADAAHWFCEQAISAGVTLQQSTAQSLLIADETVTGADTSTGQITADLTLVAAGTATTQLAQSAGVSIPIDAPPGLLIHTKPAPRKITHTVLTPDLHFLQKPDGRFIAGGDFGGNMCDNPEENARELFARLQTKVTGGAALEFSHYTMGKRPTPRDGFPVVGSPKSGLYIAAMHSGATLAAGIARMASAEITGHGRDALLASYHPNRFT